MDDSCTFKHINYVYKWAYRYGVSPVWHLVWLSKCSFRAKLLPQTVQLYGLSVACLFIWRSSEGAFAKTWKQTVHVNMDPPKWHLPWRVKSFAFENALPHTWESCHTFNTELGAHLGWIVEPDKRFAPCPTYLTCEWLSLGMVSTMYNQLITKLEDFATYLAGMAANRHGRCARTGRRFAVTWLYVEFIELDLLHDWCAILYSGNCLRRYSATY